MTNETQTVAGRISLALMRLENIRKNHDRDEAAGDVEGMAYWARMAKDARAELDKAMEHAPSGSGFDSGTTLERLWSTPECLVFQTSFHHMDKHGFYDGWTEHTVKVWPTFALGSNIKVSGRNRNNIKDYIAETFRCWLDSEVVS